MASRTVEVAIIGAGISGLSAARELTQQGFHDFEIFEATHRVGGRTLVDEDGTDLGGAYIGPTQDRILHIIEELGLQLCPVNMRGRSVQILDGQVTHYAGTIPPISLWGMFDLNAAMVIFDGLTSQINREAPHLSPGADSLDVMTAEELIIKHTWTGDARKILRTATRAVLCVEPCTISALYFLWYIAQSGGVKRIFETEGGAQDSKVVGGAGRIAELLADRYAPPGSSKLSLSSAIRRINTSGKGVVLECTNGVIIEARFLIMAIPPVQMLRIEYSPPLQAERYLSLQRWPMGCICKTFMYYKTRFWGDEGLNGTIVADKGIVCVSYDDTKPDGSMPCIMGFVLANEAVHSYTPEARMKAISQRYAEAFKSDKALDFIGYKEKKWADEQWVGGCYVGSCGPNVLTSTGRSHCEAIAEKVFIAGTESGHRMIGYIDGAVEAGERIARNVLVKLGRLEESQYDVISSPPPSRHLPPNDSMEITALEHMLPSLPTALIMASIAISFSVAGLIKLCAKVSQ